MNSNVALDALTGGLLCGLFSYLTSMYYSSTYYIKIIAFVYAAPTLYFYLLYVLSKGGKTQMNDFTIHGLLGTIITLSLMTITLMFNHLDRTTIIISNAIALSLVLLLYFGFQIYKYI
tara:strand:- start:202 stop:555 length:354 start_codon:yes stop_codon:yes gene_type:complete